jgi:prepilin peptidase CpaA
MSGAITEILLGILALMLVAAAAWDLRTRTIPNPLNAAIALLAIPFWYALGLHFWPDAAVQVGVAAAVFGLFTIAFAFGAMGGGDVKLVAAVALWLRPGDVLMLLVVMSLAGGLLTLIMLARHRIQRAEHQLEIPYGVAIALAGLWIIGTSPVFRGVSERFLYHFG